MNGNKAVLYSNVIIDASKGLISIKELVEEYEYLYLSIISYIEILGFNFTSKSEKKIVEEILNKIPIKYLDIQIADIAIQYRKTHKIKTPDAVILATAKSLAANLITRNTNDFINIDPKVRIIQPKIIV